MCKYYDYVEPYLDRVREMASAGATHIEIATALGISESAFYDYLRDFPELKIAVVEGRQSVAVEIKRALLKKALGFSYTEKKKVTKIIDGEESITEEEHEKYCLPSEQAAGMLLRNIDPDFNDKDYTSVRLREEELELKRQIAESSNFDLYSNSLALGCDDTAQRVEEVNRGEQDE